MRYANKFLCTGFYLFALLFMIAACGTEQDSGAGRSAGSDYRQTELSGENTDYADTAEPNPEAVPESGPEPTPEPIQAAGTFPFPFSFSAVDLYGNQVTEEVLGEKEAFFVYFWTTWCFSCVEGMPGLAKLAEMYAGRVGFLSLLGDFSTAKDTAIRITENSGAPFITVDAMHDDFQALMAMLNSGFVPTSVIIGRDGTAIGGQIVGSGMDRFQTAIENALGG